MYIHTQDFVDSHQLKIHCRDIDDRQYPFPEEGKDAECLKKMNECLANMLVVMKEGITNPNAECDPKPLPWTPMMCAAALNGEFLCT